MQPPLDIAKQVKDAIEAYTAACYKEPRRTHLGASSIGHPCKRHLWYSFRWAKEEQHKGRMMRLFNRGHREEERMIAYLRGIGLQVRDRDENGKQFRMRPLLGHFGGSKDAEIIGLLGDKPILGEFKTYNTKRFVELTKHGVAATSPKYAAQINTYGYSDDYDYALFMAANKNDDDLYIELLRIDKRAGEGFYKLAGEIINAKEAPKRYSESAANFECQYCVFVDICHHEEPVQRNCRSCLHSVPQDGGVWFCSRFSVPLAADFIVTGCQQHAGID